MAIDVPMPGGPRIARKATPPPLRSQPDLLRLRLVSELADMLGKEQDSEQLEREMPHLQTAEAAVKLMEIKGWLTWPEKRRFRVVVDDPDMTKPWTYEVEAPTVMGALYEAARKAIVDDPTGGMPSSGRRSAGERAVLAESPGLVDGVAMYASVVENLGPRYGKDEPLPNFGGDGEAFDMAALRRKLQEAYKRQTEDLDKRHRSKKVPDFRDHDGCRLQKVGMIVTPNEAHSKSLDELAEELASRAATLEREEIALAGGGAEVVRCFLKGHELPDVFSRVPPHLRWQGSSEEEDGIKFRHVFAVVK